jgi:hypothetical protein
MIQFHWMMLAMQFLLAGLMLREAFISDAFWMLMGALGWVACAVYNIIVTQRAIRDERIRTERGS